MSTAVSGSFNSNLVALTKYILFVTTKELSGLALSDITLHHICISCLWYFHRIFDQKMAPVEMSKLLSFGYAENDKPIANTDLSSK